MSYQLHKLNRCQRMELISESVWRRIIRAHEVNVDLKEVGITADIIVELLQLNRSGSGNYSIYAKDGWREDLYGSDLDLFVETKPDQFRWFALQAKILKKNNRYTTLRDRSNNTWQWEKLNLLEGLSGCKAYYLLYNGVKTFKTSGVDACGRTFNAPQFGCSLVEPQVIEKTVLSQSNNSRFRNPTFHDLHPKHADPWRILTCSPQYDPNFVFYPLDQIITSDPNLVSIQLEDEELVDQGDSKTAEAPIDNRIALATKESGWNPGLRIVSKRLDNPNLEL